MLNPPVNGKIQGLLDAFQVLFKANLFSRTFQDSSVYISTFQACANPEHTKYYGSRPFGFRQEDFYTLFPIKAYVKHLTPGAGPFLPPRDLI